MSLGLRLIAAMFGGMASHVFYRPSTHLRERWANMVRYAIGIICLLPFVLLVHHSLRQIENDDERVTGSILLASLPFGAGVFIGHIIDTLTSESPPVE